MAAELNMGNLYEFNKQAIENQKPIDSIIINRELKKIAESMLSGVYFFMICPDNRQYLLFKIDSLTTSDSILETLKEVIKNRGQIIDIDTTHANDQIWEIWIKDIYTGNILMYQLTNYTENVINC